MSNSDPKIPSEIEKTMEYAADQKYADSAIEKDLKEAGKTEVKKPATRGTKSEGSIRF